MQLGKNHLHGQRYRNCLSPNLFHFLLSNIRRMDPTRFAFREHDEIERIEKGSSSQRHYFLQEIKNLLRTWIA